MNARCPECQELGELRAKERVDGDVVGVFECSNCGNEWSVPI